MHKYTHKLIRTYSILKHTHTHLFISVHLYADIMIFPTPSHMPKHLCHTCTLPFPVYTHPHTHTTTPPQTPDRETRPDCCAARVSFLWVILTSSHLVVLGPLIHQSLVV